MRILSGILVAAMLAACGAHDNTPAGPSSAPDAAAIAVKLAIPAGLDVGRVSYQITAADMDTLRGDLQLIGDSLAVGTVTNIPPGDSRSFVLYAYDTAGRLTHRGSEVASVIADETVQVYIRMRQLDGQAEITGGFTEEPVPPEYLQPPSPGHPLTATWGLDVTWLDPESFDFGYDFGADGRFANRIGGAFLAPLQDLEQLQDIDLGGLRQFDGGVLVLGGTWQTAGDSLALHFDRLGLELIGQLPLVGQVRVEVLDEPLQIGSDAMLGYRYQVNGRQLKLDGKQLTLGVDMAALTNGSTLPDGISSTGGAALDLVRGFLARQVQGQKLDQFTLARRE